MISSPLTSWNTSAASCRAAAVAGYPSITVPAGFAGPLPIGMSFIGGPGTDEALLRFAAAFEDAAQARRAPAYLPTSS
ncbi:hypothetical protein [Lentzea sp. NPDC004782]|uniref:hypothetical protein n=1 Tax=Lentzea sp. NPDC004782 TaxID=3154458 RepID=UPI0033B4CFA1